MTHETRRVQRLIVAAVTGLVIGCAAVAETVAQGQDPTTAIPRIKLAELKKLMAEGGVLVVDVREQNAYEIGGHIPGAILIPLERVASKATELKSEKRPIVTYCS